MLPHWLASLCARRRRLVHAAPPPTPLTRLAAATRDARLSRLDYSLSNKPPESRVVSDVAPPRSTAVRADPHRRADRRASSYGVPRLPCRHPTRSERLAFTIAHLSIIRPALLRPEATAISGALGVRWRGRELPLPRRRSALAAAGGVGWRSLSCPIPSLRRFRMDARRSTLYVLYRRGVRPRSCSGSRSPRRSDARSRGANGERTYGSYPACRCSAAISTTTSWHTAAGWSRRSRPTRLRSYTGDDRELGCS